IDRDAAAVLCLKGISTGDFSEALAALLGKDAAGLSASAIGRLKDGWLDEYTAWQRRDLSAKRYVYIWADGIHLEARLEDEKSCILVLTARQLRTATPGASRSRTASSSTASAILMSVLAAASTSVSVRRWRACR